MGSLVYRHIRVYLLNKFIQYSTFAVVQCSSWRTARLRRSPRQERFSGLHRPLESAQLRVGLGCSGFGPVYLP